MKRYQLFGVTVGAVIMMAAVGYSALSSTIAWDPSTTDIDGQALDREVTYKVFVSDLSGGTSKLVDAGSSTQVSVDGLENNKTYVFKVKAYAEGAESEFSEELIWVSPLTLSPTVAWNPSTEDINGQALEGEVCYKLFVSDGAPGELRMVDVGLSTQTSVDGLEYNKTYTFKAKAYTADAESDYSEQMVWATPVMPDVDSDQLSDAWEIRNFGGLDVVHNLTDIDGDGTLDIDEFLAGTNPADPEDSPALNIQVAATGATVSFEARQPSGNGYENRLRYYSIMECRDLSGGIWTGIPGLENIPAENQMVRRDMEVSGQQVYYRMDIRLN